MEFKLYGVFIYRRNNNKLQINHYFFANGVHFYVFIHYIHQLCFLRWYHLIEHVFYGVDGINRKIARAPVALIFCIIILLILFGLDGFLFGLGVEYTYNDSTGTQMTVVGCYYSLE